MVSSLLTAREIAGVNQLELLARQVVEGFIVGLHKSPFHGFSVEFAEHRLYNQGESTRHIDWKVFARTDKLFSKKYEEETNLRCQLVIDASSSMYFPDEAEQKRAGIPSKMKFSAVAAAAIIHLLRRQRDAFGLTVFDSKTKLHTRARSTPVHHQLMLSSLAGLLNTPPEPAQTNAAATLHEVAESIHQRSLVVIFSDMMENLHPGSGVFQDLFSALQHLKYNKHEVILFQVMDQSKEFEFNYENRPYKFVDLESGEQLKLQPQEVKAYYLKQMEKFRKEIKAKCAQYKIDLVEADVRAGFNQVLLPYLVKRTKMM